MPSNGGTNLRRITAVAGNLVNISLSLLGYTADDTTCRMEVTCCDYNPVN